MAEPKTRPTDASVADFLASIANEHRRTDAVALDVLMRAVSGEEPVMWGTSIVGYGEVPTSNAAGQQTMWPLVAFSPRKGDLVLYLDAAIEPEQFDGLGPHRRGASCLYLKRLADVDPGTLRMVIDRRIALSLGDAAER